MANMSESEGRKAGDGQERVLCSQLSRSAGEDPVGTAATHETYFMLETPPPWPAQAVEAPHVPEGVREALRRAEEGGRDVRFLAIASDTQASPAGFRRAIVYRRPAGGLFARYEKSEFLVPERELPALADAAAEGSEQLARFAAYEAEPAETRDFFVCTHGGRDVCCGTFGYPLYRWIEERHAAPSSGLLRAWRVSHLGGHRFAPTLADFPEGRYWARVEPGDDADRIVRRDGPVEGVYGKCRGWGGVGKQAQALEREIFLRVGWPWTEYARRSELLGRETDGMRVRISYRSADGAAQGAYEGIVSETGRVPTGGCGAEAKDVTQYKARIESSSTGLDHARPGPAQHTAAPS